MNRKSIAALALAAAMTVGVGASSYAWFTSQATSAANTVQTGTLALTGTDGSSALRNFSLNNLYPGIGGSKSDAITVKNNGSINLQYKVSAKYRAGDGPLYNIAQVKVTKSSGDIIFNGNLKDLNQSLANTTLAVGRSETLGFVVSLPDNAGNEYQGKTASVDFVFDASQNINTSEWIGGGGYGTVTANNDGSINLKGETVADAEGYKIAPYSKSFTNTNTAWTGNYFTETDVYLDPTMELGKGFDLSVALTRDFVFHVAKDTSSKKLLVGASNNSSDGKGEGIREDLDDKFTNNEITEAGWYTFQHKFYKDGGELKAQMSILNKDKKVIFTKTLDETEFTSFGVAKYSWFTFITVPGGLNVKNHRDYVTP